MARILDVTGDDRDQALGEAAHALRAGELVVLPTDTVYGVAADAFNPTGTGRVFTAKQRSRAVPLPVLVHGPRQLAGLTTLVPEAAERLMAAYWPGPLTIVIASEPNLSWDLGDTQGTVAVRMPFEPVTIDLIKAVGPLAVTSANRSGEPPAVTAQAAHEALGDAVSVYLDAGERGGLAPSAIVDLTRVEPHVIRAGDLPEDEILAVANGELDPADATQVEPPVAS
ncbi:MAG TPA: L-threonylcarbamoyladenylate synthase [Nitriliruptorales bacterium]